MAKKAIWGALIFTLIIGLSKSEEPEVEPVLDSEEIVSNEEAKLLRNFFTVNLSSRSNQRRKGQPSNNARNFVETKRGTQRKRLNELFQALSDPLGCKFLYELWFSY